MDLPVELIHIDEHMMKKGQQSKHIKENFKLKRETQHPFLKKHSILNHQSKQYAVKRVSLAVNVTDPSWASSG